MKPRVGVMQTTDYSAFAPTLRLQGRRLPNNATATVSIMQALVIAITDEGISS
jgi:hypothetical protein